MKKATPEQLILSELQNLQTELAKHLLVLNGLLQKVEAGRIALAQEQQIAIGRSCGKLRQTIQQVETEMNRLRDLIAHKVIFQNNSEDQEIK